MNDLGVILKCQNIVGHPIEAVALGYQLIELSVTLPSRAQALMVRWPWVKVKNSDHRWITESHSKHLP